jgi:hypothetical protein
MKKLKWKQLLILIITVILLCPTYQVQAKVQGFQSLYMEVTLPDDTIVLTADTPNMDEQWSQAEITDPKSVKKTFSSMGVQAILYDPVTKTEVRLLQNSSSESSEVFNLSLLSEDELTNFLNGLLTSTDENTTYTIEKYSQEEVPFFRVSIQMKNDTGTASELIYGTVVNGKVISYDIYHENSSEPINENYIKELVAGTHFTEFLDKAEVEKEGKRNMIVLVTSALILIGLVILLIVLTTRKNKKQVLIKKQKSATFAKFFKEQAEKEAQNIHDPVHFLNRTTYTEEVVKQFCYYDAIFHHLKRWIITVLLFLVLLLSFLDTKYALLSVIIAVILLFFTIYFQGLQIEKTIKTTMKTYEKNRSMEAVFTFCDDYYTLSGIQSSSKYPYVQITEIKEYKEYIYLYLGSEKALYLKKDGFEQELAEFMKFIKDKIK